MKKVYLFALIAIIIVAVVIALFYSLQNKEEKNVSEYVSDSFRTLKAVPVDAIGIWLFSSPETMAESVLSVKHPFSGLIDQQNGLFKISNRLTYLTKSEDIFRSLRNSDLLASLHYSGKNEISVLICVDLENLDNNSKSNLIERLTDGNVGTYRNFNGAVLYNSSGAIITIHKNYLLVSTSPLLVEASVRHLNSGGSILDNSDFAEIAGETVVDENILFVNHMQLGKFFSGLASPKYLKYADFASKYSSWSVMNASFQQHSVLLEGRAYNHKGAGNYSSALRWSDGKESEAQYVVPHNTYALFSFSPKGANFNFSGIREYRELAKKLNPEIWEKASEWIKSSDIQEIALAAIPYGGNFEWVTLYRHAKKNLFKRVSDKLFSGGELLRDSIIENRNSKLLSELTGSLFASNNEEYLIRIGEWTITGNKNILEEFRSGRTMKFSMGDFISQTPAAGEIVNHGIPFSVTLNYTGMQDSLTAFFNKGVSGVIKQSISKNNLGIVNYSIVPNKDYLTYRLLFYSRNLEKLPVPPVEESKDGPAGWQLDSIVKIPEGPFELRNFDTGEKEYLVQLKNFRLQLADKDLKGIWAIPFETPLRGYVEQVDFYNNGKLQMLFASGNMVYLLDRTGRYINPFPKRVSRLIELGPKVYRTGDSFMIMLLHTDNSLSLYDRECKQLEAWTDINVDETIKDFPELMETGGNRYWILRTQVKTRIYTINGLEITNVLGTQSLLPNTPVKKISDNEVEVRRSDGADIRLNLETGNIKKLKKRR